MCIVCYSRGHSNDTRPRVKITRLFLQCRRFSEVISSWKRGNTPVPVTWESLVKALESSSVDEGGLAKKLRKKCGMEVTESPADTG